MSNFAALGLSEEMVQTVTNMGFVEPTAIQKQAIPLLLSTDVDLVGLAQTGTGKTASFGLPLIERVNTDLPDTQALVLAPTRELCLQISKEFKLFSAHLPELKICAVYGGVDIVRQMREVKRGAHIIVATPGRLRDLMNRKAVDIRSINYVVLDEADEMLNMGFKEEIDEILEGTPKEKLTWLFSATMPAEVRRIASSYMSNPVELSVGDRNTSNADIAHQFVVVTPRDRYEVLRRFLDYTPDVFGLVFTRTRMDAQELAEQLTRDGYNADALHGDLNQAQRDRVMERFRNRSLRILVATDVAARGIDVQDISHVFHFNIPDDLAFYTHRSGRTGRAGSKGVSLVLLHPRDKMQLQRLEKQIKTRFEEVTIPTGMEIVELRLMSYMQQLRNTQPSVEMNAYMPLIMQELQGLSKEDLAHLIAASAFDGMIKNYKNSPDYNDKNKGPKKKEATGPRFDPAIKRRRLFVNIGAADTDSEYTLREFICELADIPVQALLNVDMNKRHSYLDVEEGVARKMMEVFNDLTIEGRAIRMNYDAGSGNNGANAGNGKPKNGKGQRGEARSGGKEKMFFKDKKQKKAKKGKAY